MLRYITAVTIAALLLAVALRSRGTGAEAETPPTGGNVALDVRPELNVTPAPGGGLDLKLRHRFAGSVSRATLMYRLDGADCTLDRTTNCQKSLTTSAEATGGGYESEVELAGRLPEGFSSLRLILEDETGTHVLPVSLD